MEELLTELITMQQKVVRECADRIHPNLTDDDLLQPNDFPDLENHPLFRYEEGVLAGLMTAEAAWRREKRIKDEG